MIFKVEVIEATVHLIRAYRKRDDIKFFFSCVLHKANGEKEWHIHIASSDKKGTFRETGEVLRYLKSYPDGAYTYVTKEDMDRFYRRFCKRIKFDDCDF